MAMASSRRLFPSYRLSKDWKSPPLLYPLYHPYHRCHPFNPLPLPKSWHRGHRQDFRPHHLGLVYYDGGLGHLLGIQRPGVFVAISPTYAANFFVHNGWKGFLVLGSVFLVITGGEALYADMGHFGKVPIQVAWFTVVLPSLLLNYFGQGALLLEHPDAIENPFYRMAPSWALLSDRHHCDHGDRYCLASVDYGRFFADHASHPTELFAAPTGRTYLTGRTGTDLYSRHQLVVDDFLYCACLRL